MSRTKIIKDKDYLKDLLSQFDNDWYYSMWDKFKKDKSFDKVKNTITKVVDTRHCEKTNEEFEVSQAITFPDYLFYYSNFRSVVAEFKEFAEYQKDKKSVSYIIKDFKKDVISTIEVYSKTLNFKSSFITSSKSKLLRLLFYASIKPHVELIEYNKTEPTNINVHSLENCEKLCNTYLINGQPLLKYYYPLKKDLPILSPHQFLYQILQPNPQQSLFNYSFSFDKKTIVNEVYKFIEKLKKNDSTLQYKDICVYFSVNDKPLTPGGFSTWKCKESKKTKTIPK